MTSLSERERSERGCQGEDGEQLLLFEAPQRISIYLSSSSSLSLFSLTSNRDSLVEVPPPRFPSKSFGIYSKSEEKLYIHLTPERRVILLHPLCLCFLSVFTSLLSFSGCLRPLLLLVDGPIRPPDLQTLAATPTARCISDSLFIPFVSDPSLLWVWSQIPTVLSKTSVLGQCDSPVHHDGEKALNLHKHDLVI